MKMGNPLYLSRRNQTAAHWRTDGGEAKPQRVGEPRGGDCGGRMTGVDGAGAGEVNGIDTPETDIPPSSRIARYPLRFVFVDRGGTRTSEGAR